MNITHATYTLPIKLPRNQYGVTTNTSFISSSNDLFAATNAASSIENGNGSSGSYIPDFIGATNEYSGVRGLVPAPQAGDNNKWLKGSGGWEEIPIMTGATEFGFAGHEGLAPAPPVGSYSYYLTGGGNWVLPNIFTPATSTENGSQGEVPGPSIGQSSYYLMEATGDWVFNAAQKWLHEWPTEPGLEPSGLGIDGDFHVGQTLSTFNLEVEGRAHFWELVIDRVKANGGQLLVSPSNFKVDEIGPTIIRWIDEEPLVSILEYRPDIARALDKVDAVAIKCQRVYMHSKDDRDTIVPSVTIGDMLRCRSFNIGPGVYEDVSNKDYWTFVLGVGSEQFKEVPEGGDINSCMGNYIDLAICILTNEEAYPIDTVIEDDGSVVVPPDYDPTYEIADLKDISEQVRTGQHDRMEEFPNQEEMDEITVAVLNLPAIPIPDELIDVDDYIFHYEPEVDNTTPVELPYSPSSAEWASELEKYNNDPLYADWQFGYGKIEISIGDELACLGHLVDIDRRNAIILSSNTSIDPTVKSPAIAQYSGIDIFGISISHFRLTTIAKNGNYFYGYFGVDTGSNPGSYMTLGEAITTAVSYSNENTYQWSYSYVSQTYDMLYSYITNSDGELSRRIQTANAFIDEVYSYAKDTHSYAYQSADQIWTYVENSYGYMTDYMQNAYSITLAAYDLARNAYSYSTIEAGGIWDYVYDAYSYSLSYTYQTATDITTLVYNTKDDTYSYVNQKADSITSFVYSYVGDTYSLVEQRADNITSTVSNLSSYTYSSIEQLSDEINLAVTKNDLEVVGIHLDGAYSTVNIVGSLAVHQNGDDDTDTVKVYDEDEVLRVEITPEEIPAKSELSINDITRNLEYNSMWSTIRKDYNTANRSIQYITYWNISSTVHTGDILSLINPSFTLSLVPEENTSFGATQFISSWDCWFKVETTTGESVISTGLGGSGVPSDYLQTYKTVTFKKSGNYSSGALDNSFDGKNLKITFYANFTFTSNAPSVSSSWNLASGDTGGSINYRPASGVGDTTFMQIGSNGFYYSYSGDYYLYSGEDGFEVSSNNNKISVDSNDVKICRSAYFTSDYIFIGTSNPDTYSSIINCTSTRIDPTYGIQAINLGDPGLYGLGRELIIIGFQGLRIGSALSDLWIYSYINSQGRYDRKIAPNSGTLILANTDYDDTTYYYHKSNGTIRFIALADGWHILQ